MAALDTYATSFPHQFSVLLLRAFRNFYRNPFALIGNVSFVLKNFVTCVYVLALLFIFFIIHPLVPKR